MSDFVILGAGIAGISAAETLRKLRPDASLLLVNGEARPPYKRTSLSKQLAAGPERLDDLHSAAWYAERGITLRHGTRALELDTSRKLLRLDSGETLAFGALLLATGAEASPPRARPDAVPPGAVLPPGFRKYADALALRSAWLAAGRAEILGGGILGVELALQARRMGLQTTVHARGALLERELPAELSGRLGLALEARGITVAAWSCMEAFSGPSGAWIAATGSRPCTGLARSAGLECNTGIRVDASFRASAPGFWAAGDCAELPGGHICHLWHDAEAQGRAAARSMSGLEPGYADRPWRIKLDLDDDYFFSMNPGAADALERIALPPTAPGTAGIIQYWWGKAERISGVAVAGDPSRAEQYEQAVLEGWSLKRVRHALG